MRQSRASVAACKSGRSARFPLVLSAYTPGFSCVSTASGSGLKIVHDDVVTQTDRRLDGGVGAPGLGRRRTRGRSAGSSFRCIGRRRFDSPRPRTCEFGWCFGHYELAGCDVQVRLGSRSCRSCRPNRLADRQPRCRRCHAGPRPRLPYASSSALPSSSISIVCRTSHATIVLARERARTSARPNTCRRGKAVRLVGPSLGGVKAAFGDRRCPLLPQGLRLKGG